jgi:signal transduction histidine kinase
MPEPAPESPRRATRDQAVEKLYAAETQALRKAELALTRQQLSDVVYEPFRELVKNHRRLLRQSMKLTTLSDSVQLQLRTATRDLTAALARVQELNTSLQTLQRERDELFAMAVHDLKNPLAGMCGLATLLADGHATADEMPEFGRDILQLGEGMLGTVGDLVDLHRYEEGSIETHPTRLALTDLAERIRAPLEPAARRKRIRLAVFAPAKVVNTDADLVLRIAGNLATNALKFSPAGTSVAITLDYDADTLRVVVADQGPGISAADQKKLFKKFARLSARPTGGETSSGLGLAIVKRLVELLGGTVACESALGAGATFRVEIPITPA